MAANSSSGPSQRLFFEQQDGQSAFRRRDGSRQTATAPAHDNHVKFTRYVHQLRSPFSSRDRESSV